jgi:putative addiction module component (TIGR02574 family)
MRRPPNNVCTVFGAPTTLLPEQLRPGGEAMPQSIEEIEATVPALPREDRARLAERLMDSLADEASVEAAWRATVRRRVEELRNGRARTVDGDEVMKELIGRHR